VLEDLSDLDCGRWQVKTHDEARRSDPETFVAWFATRQLVRLPEGESLQDMALRSGEALRLILASHPRETIVVVGHDSINRVLLMQLLDQPLSLYWRLAQSPCCINEITIEDGHKSPCFRARRSPSHSPGPRRAANPRR